MRRTTFSFISLIIFVYVAVRAATVDFTFDEIWTVSVFTPESFYHIITLQPTDANNHLLNTLFIKFCIFLFGDSPFISRLPNLLALALYMAIAVKFLRLFEHRAAYIFTFLLLTVNPFVLDFFGLARGYGLAMSFELTAVYCLTALWRRYTPAHLIAGVLASMLSVLSNFSFLPFTLVYSALLVFALLRSERHRQRIIGSTIAGYLVFGLSLLPLLLRLRSAGSFYYGGNTGFYADSLTSLLQYSTGRHFSTGILAIPLQLAVIVAVLVIIAAMAASIIRGGGAVAVPAIVLLTGVCLVVWLMQVILHSPYPIDRTALFLYPLLCIGIGLALDTIISRAPLLFSGLALAGSVLLIVNFGYNANLYKTISWNFEGHAREILSYINEAGRKEHKKYAIDCSWPVEKQMKYYISRNQYEYLYPLQPKANRDSIATGAEYYILMDLSMTMVGYGPQIERVDSAFTHQELDRSADHVWLLRR